MASVRQRRCVSMLAAPFGARLAALAVASTLVIFPTFAVAQAAATSPAALHFGGKISFWSRPACPSPVDCAPPKAFSPALPVHVDFDIPITPGAHLVFDQTFSFEGWQLQLMMVWINPRANTAADAATNVPYVVTQMRLSEKRLGVFAECSRFDGIDELKFLPPGGCSGRIKSSMYGVSTLSR